MTSKQRIVIKRESDLDQLDDVLDAAIDALDGVNEKVSAVLHELDPSKARAEQDQDSAALQPQTTEACDHDSTSSEAVDEIAE